MQNNNKPGGFRRFMRDNGYYIVIGVCILAIGVSGFFLLRGGDAAEETASLNVPVTVKTDETEAGAETHEDAVIAGAETEPAIAEFPPDDTAEIADDLHPIETVPTSRTVLPPVSGETLAAYSVSSLAYNATTRDWRTHNGIDLAAAQGTSITAAEAGTVSAVYTDDYLGTTVEIRHDSGYTTVYANLEENPAVSVGQSVLAGDVIGTVGTSALLEVGQAPHLHFAVFRDGVSVDPAEYLS